MPHTFKDSPNNIANLPVELRDEILRQRGVNFAKCRAEGVDINLIYNYLAVETMKNIEITSSEPVEEELDYEYAKLATQIQAGILK